MKPEIAEPAEASSRARPLLTTAGALETPAAPQPDPHTDPTSAGRGAPPLERRLARRRRRHHRHLVDALTGSQRLGLACLALAWALLTASAWTWWFAPSNSSSPVALAINTGLLAVEMLLLPLWFFFWLWRMKRPNPALEVPQLRTAMVVTKAPSEPWSMVHETLEAMLAQDFPFPFDTWLADESPGDETRRWCAENGVRISTRQGVAAYHQATWPRRTRCKEGNLAFFYDMWGYDSYDVVAQLDADHVPARDYLRHFRSMTRWWDTSPLRASATATPEGPGPLEAGCTPRRCCTDRPRPATAADMPQAALAPITRCGRQRCGRSVVLDPSWRKTSPPR